MIKSLIILILLIVLSAGLFLTRPAKESFAQHVKEQQSSADGGLLGKIAAQVGTDWYVDSCTFNDKYLWTEIHRDGRTMFYGVFGRWWGSDPQLSPAVKST